MKKIKKILPLLLGVMVLMFGTLTVCASNVTQSDIDAVNAFESFIHTNKLTESTYNCKLFVRTSDDAIYYILSDNPLEIKNVGAAGVSSWYAKVDTNWKYLRYVDGKVTLTTTGVWKADSSGSSTGSIRLCVGTYDVYYHGNSTPMYNSDTSFFPVPPVAQVATALPPVVQNQTRVILITAVACLALLVILLVLPKKLPRFLNR